MAVERGRSHELVGSMVGAVYVHVLRTLAQPGHEPSTGTSGCHKQEEEEEEEGAMSCEYGGWGRTSQLSASKVFLTTLATCCRALSC